MRNMSDSRENKEKGAKSSVARGMRMTAGDPMHRRMGIATCRCVFGGMVSLSVMGKNGVPWEPSHSRRLGNGASTTTKGNGPHRRAPDMDLPCHQGTDATLYHPAVFFRD